MRTSCEGLVIDPDERKVLVDGVSVRLTITEHRLLCHLADNAGRTFTRREIIGAVKGEDYPATDRTVDVQVNGLRKKLGKHGDWIEAVRGMGYRFRRYAPAVPTKPAESEAPHSHQNRPQ